MEWILIKRQKTKKKLGNFDKKLIKEIEYYNNNIHGTMKFEDSIGNIDFSEFD